MLTESPFCDFLSTIPMCLKAITDNAISRKMFISYWLRFVIRMVPRCSCFPTLYLCLQNAWYGAVLLPDYEYMGMFIMLKHIYGYDAFCA